MLKRDAAWAGLDPGEVAGHSLRAGLATSAAAWSPRARHRRAAGHRGMACFAGTSTRAPCSVRTPPARLGCKEGEAAGRLHGGGNGSLTSVVLCEGKRNTTP